MLELWGGGESSKSALRREILCRSARGVTVRVSVSAKVVAECGPVAAHAIPNVYIYIYFFFPFPYILFLFFKLILLPSVAARLLVLSGRKESLRKRKEK